MASGEFPNVDPRGNALSVSRSLALLREENSHYKLCGALNGVLEGCGHCGEGEFHLACRLLNSGRPVGSPLLQWLSYRSNWCQIQKQMRPSRSVKCCLPFKCWMFLSFNSGFYFLAVLQTSTMCFCAVCWMHGIDSQMIIGFFSINFLKQGWTNIGPALLRERSTTKY